MPPLTSAEKRARATALTVNDPGQPVPGNLAIDWGSPFDRLCYQLSAPGLARKQPQRYEQLMQELTDQTGCNEEELREHGFKVRSVLFFAEDRLGRQGSLARLAGAQQVPFRLAPVTHSF